MNKIEFEHLEDFISDLDRVRYGQAEGDVSVIGHYSEIKEILNDLVVFGYTMYSIDLEHPMMEHYTKEIKLTIDQDCDIWVEKVWDIGDSDYKGVIVEDPGFETIYLLPSCSDKLIEHVTDAGTKVIFTKDFFMDAEDTDELDGKEESECDEDTDELNDKEESECDEDREALRHWYPGFQWRKMEGKDGSTETLTVYSNFIDFVREVKDLIIK